MTRATHDHLRAVFGVVLLGTLSACTGGGNSGGGGDGGAAGASSSSGGGSDGGGGVTDAGGRDAGTPDAHVGPPSTGLVVVGNRIQHVDGTPFHGRGANLHDERSCSACSFAPANPDGVDRWADELIDGWHANFVRFLLASKAAPYNQFEQQWQNLVADPQYLADVVQNVHHMTSKEGVYVLVTLFADDTIKPENSDFDSEWPSSAGDTNTRYTALAQAFLDDPKVLFGLTNEPHTTASHAAELAAVYLDAIAAIRAVEDANGAPHHIVVAQAPVGWSRDLTYFVNSPLPGDQIAYEIHPYNPASDFQSLIVDVARVLPIIIGEYGPAGSMTESDAAALWVTAQANEVPYLAWNFHMRCSPDLLQDTASDGCGLDASTGYNFPRTAWGNLLYNHLATPW